MFVRELYRLLLENELSGSPHLRLVRQGRRWLLVAASQGGSWGEDQWLPVLPSLPEPTLAGFWRCLALHRFAEVEPPAAEPAAEPAAKRQCTLRAMFGGGRMGREQ